MRFFVNMIGFLVLAWAVGFGVFVHNIPREGDADAQAQVASARPDETGIVALTGGGLTRIRAALSLMEAGTGRKVLITGTHPDTKKEELASYIENSDGLFACCVDLGQRALTTKGNAIETRDWVSTNRFRRVIVVTTDYHMPRARAEIRHSMQTTEVIAWPVASPLVPEKGWMASAEAWQLLITEYNKYLLVRAAQILQLD